MQAHPIALEPVEILRECDLGWIDRGTALRLGDQLSAPDLRLALRAGEGMPSALSLAGLRIAHIDYDGPMAG